MESEKEGIRYRERGRSRLKTTSSCPRVSNRNRPLRGTSKDIARFIPSFLKLPEIRHDKIKQIRALVEKGQYETEKRLRITAERIAKLLIRVS